MQIIFWPLTPHSDFAKYYFFPEKDGAEKNGQEEDQPEGTPEGAG
jgi:hypothetical protein